LSPVHSLRSSRSGGSLNLSPSPYSQSLHSSDFVTPTQRLALSSQSPQWSPNLLGKKRSPQVSPYGRNPPRRKLNKFGRKSVKKSKKSVGKRRK
jgi:hypothetical protein